MARERAREAEMQPQHASTSSSRALDAAPVFVDAVTGRHTAQTPRALLDTRRLQWRKDYGWTCVVVFFLRVWCARARVRRRAPPPSLGH